MTESEAIEIVQEEKTYMDRHAGKVQTQALLMAIKALELQIPKKPIMKLYFEDMEEEYLYCPTCGEILTDRIPDENKNFYFHCFKCGQAFDWSDEK